MHGEERLKILFVGPYCHGSNAGGLARALRRNGHLVQVVDPDHFRIVIGTTIGSRAVGRLFRPLLNKAINRRILMDAAVLKPDVCLVYKGEYINPDTLTALKRAGIQSVLFYPDVSMICHGPAIPRSIPFYDLIITTKTFGIVDLRDLFSITNAEFVPHGSDLDINRPFPINDEDLRQFGADVSFIGTWSPKKEDYLTKAVSALPDVNFRIWGAQWERSNSRALDGVIQGCPILGDLYPLTIQCSKINVGLLSEKRRGASSGDVTTARTFEIPASGGFMLHERTEELLRFFEEDDEVGCFGSPDELVSKIQYYLPREELRSRIADAGRERCVREYSLDHRAQRVAQLIKSRLLSQETTYE